MKTNWIIAAVVVVVAIFGIGLATSRQQEDPKGAEVVNNTSHEGAMEEESNKISDGEPVNSEPKAVLPTRSRIEWSGKKAVGAAHQGVINVASGRLDIGDGRLTGGEIVVDMATIENSDLAGASKGKLEGHLESEDFFSISEFPTAKLMIKDVQAAGGNRVNITGDMTIKGITNEISFPATVTTSSSETSVTAEVTLDRSKWDVRFGSGSFFEDLGDDLIEDNFDLKVSLLAN